jgi:hypothetical protein
MNLESIQLCLLLPTVRRIWLASCPNPSRPPHEHRLDLADSEELEMFPVFDGFGPKRWFVLGDSTGVSCLFWKKDHAEFRRLGSQVLDFGCLVFGFVVLHALVDILGSIFEHSVEEHG